MPQHQPVAHVSIKVAGTLIPEDAKADLLQVIVDHSLHMPSMFTLRLRNDHMKWLEEGLFREGKLVEISAGESAVKLISGKIAALEGELEEGEPSLLVRGYDLAHTLYRGRHRRSFLQVTDADLATRLASEAGLRPGTIDSTPNVHEYVFQNNQTNAEFLLERARRHGYELCVEDEELHFRRPVEGGTSVTISWGEDLYAFRPRMSTAEQVNEVEVRGWNPKQKREVVGRAVRGNGAPKVGLKQGADLSRSAWGEAKIAIVDQFVSSPAEAEKMAQAALDELASAFVEAEGTCDMHADIAPGRQLRIENVGTHFSGTYYVTRATHHWTVAQGMLTHFGVSGRRDRAVWSLIQDMASIPTKMGMAIGIVSNNKDPDELGRVKVKFPWLSETDESAWARVVSPMAGNERGFLYLPEIEDEVLVGFEHGDIHRPYVLGALWNGRDKLPMPAAQAVGGDGKVNKRILKSRSGHTITLDDTSGGEQITIVDSTGNNLIVLHSPDNSMQIKVQGDLTIEAQGKITLRGRQGVDMSSEADFSVKGQRGVDVTSDASLSIKGLSGTVEATGSLTLKNAAAKIALTGPSVNINDGALEVT